jgi:alanine dehydrogenase
MLIGVPKEVKSQEYRVGLVPSSVREIVKLGAAVLIEKNAGIGIKVSDEEYISAGATIADSADEVYSRAELIVKVKEPQSQECKMLREGQTIFTFLHLAPDPLQTRLLVESGATAIAYETVTQEGGGLPLLTPMSEVAGRLAIQAGAHCLEVAQGGSGKLIGGVPGVSAGNVLVIGGGVVGSNAIRIAVGMGAKVTVLDNSLHKLRELEAYFKTSISTVYSTDEILESVLQSADVVVGAVLVPGASAPKIITREMLRIMQPGSVLVDVAIDQGGCFDTSKPTTHNNPTFVVDDIVHYCVANMPGVVPRTSTFALNNATLPFITKMVKHGIRDALRCDKHLLNGLNVCKGKVTYEVVAKEQNYDYVPAIDAIL